MALPAEGPGIEVLDFNFDPNSPRVNTDPSLQQDICIDPTVIPAGDVFSDDVVSSLPYIKTTMRGVLNEDFAGFAIDEERIIAISVSSIVAPLGSEVYFEVHSLFLCYRLKDRVATKESAS